MTIYLPQNQADKADNTAAAMPLSVGRIHLTGIGGIGMSGIAELLHSLGYTVCGSDLSENANVDRLRKLGIEVMIGQRAENIHKASVVVISSAIKPDNAEFIAARAAGIPVVRRAEMLAELMRLKWSIAVAGTHGKTTTTSMVAHLLDRGEFDPTVINGGIINAYGSNARHGKGKWMVVEADESDGTFIRIPATIGIITNIDPEHLDYYGDYDSLRGAFRRFVENIPFYGFATACLDHPEVQALIGDTMDRRILTYGMSAQADMQAVDLRMDASGSYFSVICNDRIAGKAQEITDLFLPMVGQHNVQNSLAAMTVALELGISPERIRESLASFGGVKRRFTKTGDVNGITIIDDYGHHPVEINAVLNAARAAQKGHNGRVIAVAQPHRYSRLESLFDDFCTCFNDADIVLVAPVHAAGETPIPGVGRDALIAGLQKHGHRHVLGFDGEDQLPELLSDHVRSGDMVICLGAGSISAWANRLPKTLQDHLNAKKPQAVGA